MTPTLCRDPLHSLVDWTNENLSEVPLVLHEFVAADGNRQHNECAGGCQGSAKCSALPARGDEYCQRERRDEWQKHLLGEQTKRAHHSKQDRRASPALKQSPERGKKQRAKQERERVVRDEQT